MSKIRKLLEEKRKAQIAKMEGREPEDPEIDAKLREVSRRSIQPPKRKQLPPSRGLWFTYHAKQRMGQRGMSKKHVYAIYKHGEERKLRDSTRTAYVVSNTALNGMAPEKRALLAKFHGAAIIVQKEDNPERMPALITILADGEDTQFG
jgi:hypothetical protein